MDVIDELAKKFTPEDAIKFREVIRMIAPQGSVNEIKVRKMTSFEEAERIYRPSEQLSGEKK